MWGTVAADIKIEEGDSTELAACPDCGRNGLAVWGYVSKGGSAQGAYYACWVDAHPERGAQILLGVGKFGGNTSGADRRMIGIECRMGQDRPNYMVVDASKVKLEDDTLGAGLTRQEVLSHPEKDEFFRVLDQITATDRRIKKFLCRV